MIVDDRLTHEFSKECNQQRDAQSEFNHMHHISIANWLKFWKIENKIADPEEDMSAQKSDPCFANKIFIP